MYYIIDIMKAMACFLIANFHSDILFPDKISILAFGGDIGNNIFFMVSGFTLLESVQKSSSGWKWYKRRLYRLLPTLLFFYLLNVLLGAVKIDGILAAIKSFVFPTIYWFTGAILVFYLLFFFIVKYLNMRCWWGGVIFLLVLSSCIFDNIYSERYLIGFAAMMAGASIKKQLCWIEGKKGIKYLPGLFLVTAFLYAFLKIVNAGNTQWHRFTHCGVGVMTLFVGAEILIWGCCYQSKLEDFFMRHRSLYKVIKGVSQITLAVYLLMGLDGRILMKTLMENISFPASYIVNMCVSFGLAYIYTLIERKLKNRM